MMLKWHTFSCFVQKESALRKQKNSQALTNCNFHCNNYKHNKFNCYNLITLYSYGTVLEDKMKDKPMCYGEAHNIKRSMTQNVIDNAVLKFNGRVLLSEVRSKLKTERPRISVNDPRWATANDKLMKLKAISSQVKLFK